MSRIAKALAAISFAAAMATLASCEPVQNPYGTTGTAGASSLGNSGHASLPAPSSAGTVSGGTIDSAQSQGLSDYLKHHSLPLVGAKVVTSTSGGRQVILFGFVASEYGKSDAEARTRNYLKDASVVVDNRIKISPELAGAHSGSGSSSGSSGSAASGSSSGSSVRDSSDPYASSGSIQDYQNNQPPDAYAYQQQGQYQQYNGGTPPSMFTTLLPLLLGGGVGFGSGGGSFGGFTSGYAPSYGGYGYPTYPPPMPSSGFGPSGGYPYP